MAAAFEKKGIKEAQGLQTDHNLNSYYVKVTKCWLSSRHWKSTICQKFEHWFESNTRGFLAIN